MWKNRLFLILSAICVIIAGIILVRYPDQSFAAIVHTVGIALTVSGIIGVLTYLFSSFIRNPIFLVTSLIRIIGGVIILLNPDFVSTLFPILAGIMIANDGIGQLVVAVLLKRRGSSYWFAALLLALAVIALGILVICYPFEAALVMMRVFGVVLIADGFFGIVLAFML